MFPQLLHQREMATSKKPLLITHYDHLLRVEESRQGKIEVRSAGSRCPAANRTLHLSLLQNQHVHLANNRAVCITQTHNKQKKTLALDLDDPIRVVQTWQNTEAGAMNSHSKLVVLVGGQPQ